jgi:P27 family predicted phage terminase small subunit
MAKTGEFEGFLSAQGKVIYDAILKHCQENGITKSIDTFELSMLANSFDLYSINAKFCKKNGTTQQPEKGGWDQIRPEYTVMRNEYQNVLKHSSKFGLNPGDRAKIFNGLKQKEKKKGFDLK